ncbi:MAG: transposase domain-containing protein [Candidatus Melainabacteria bacterium]|nr:transposase domain-containing protein [Candidatus Melainabacteria bacterium]
MRRRKPLRVSCKRNNINPIEYFADVFSRIGSMKTSEIDQLLPHRWAQNRSQTKSAETSA